MLYVSSASKEEELQSDSQNVGWEFEDDVWQEEDSHDKVVSVAFEVEDLHQRLSRLIVVQSPARGQTIAWIESD